MRIFRLFSTTAEEGSTVYVQHTLVTQSTQKPKLAQRTIFKLSISLNVAIESKTTLRLQDWKLNLART